MRRPRPSSPPNVEIGSEGASLAIEAVAPAAALAVVALYAGTFVGGATFLGSTSSLLILLVAAVWGARAGWDPLRLGPGRWLPAALWLSIALSMALSSVSRAGRTAVVIAPLMLFAPAAVERCLAGRRRRELGLTCIGVVVLLLCAYAWLEWLVVGTERLAMPLGHHNLLALTLLPLLPLAAAADRSRVFGLAVAVLAAATVLVSRSLAGALGLVVELGMLALLWPGGRRALRRLLALMIAALTVAALLLGPRALRIAAGEDRSSRVRWSYARAAADALAERPWLGQGPGASSWTFHRFLETDPDLLPSGAVITDSHSLVLDLGFELGVTGVALAATLMLAFLAARRRELAMCDCHQRVLAVGLAGCAGFLGASLVAGLFDVVAPLVALLLAAGVALCARPRGFDSSSRAGRGLTALVAALVLAAAVPGQLAQRQYERARSSKSLAARASALESAVSLDPEFPLYRLRWAIEMAAQERPSASLEAQRAARSAGDLMLLWLAAGVLADHSGATPRPEALRRACDLAPDEPLAPAYLWRALGGGEGVVTRALAVEPLLMASSGLEGAGASAVLASAGQLITSDERIDAGWRLGFEAALERVLADLQRPDSASPRELDALELVVDASGETSLSLFAFRRSAWPFSLGSIELDRRRLALIDLPSVIAAPGLPAGVFDQGCGWKVADHN